ncbi:MAG: hypothetical protein KJ970_15375 [Candidatus Eisenbacteria bacterium]|uniref:Uncharacterized protein n=1 Tax=Eiseniibacteriota bacterium TaxID=2212470 RepID=A0A948WDZ4_UNCEI|nr:hypothetical protein [Candidatus Eisenbacteria bacterium]MBU1948180.1 hypothetical protein [Candidatus Eisenbacteria bacterium]MBU2692303.1 hypothetical protein [Candidatus Eisenbacteria bacterium]
MIRDCELVIQATGRRALTLRELREGLAYVSGASIYYHFWGRFLRPTYNEPEYNNDFASWAHLHLNDKELAERLSVINPADFSSLETLRQELIDIIEMRIDETHDFSWNRADQQFHFILTKIIIFGTGQRVETPEDLPKILPQLSPSSIFYHFIDARRRTPNCSDDFSAWLSDLSDEYAPLCETIQAIDPYFSSLTELREELTRMTGDFFAAGRLTERNAANA